VENTLIEWAEHTFNPWWGCAHVSPGCVHCYAETWAARCGQHVWGAHGPRRMMSESYWREPLRWNAAAADAADRPRVFCASMADVFEDHPALPEPRRRLWGLIDDTPNLDWLLLTKRPENIDGLVPWGNEWPDNVWIGTSVEDQRRAEERIPFLVATPARTRFLSCEPLLGMVGLEPWLWLIGNAGGPWYDVTQRRRYVDGLGRRLPSGPGACMVASVPSSDIHWVIAGGESGPKARPMHPDWARMLRDQCAAAGVPFLFKQWGEWAPTEHDRWADRPKSFCSVTVWGEVTPGPAYGIASHSMERLGKHRAGRILDGRTHDDRPYPLGVAS
jgi:protein gp37